MKHWLRAKTQESDSLASNPSCMTWLPDLSVLHLLIHKMGITVGPLLESYFEG